MSDHDCNDFREDFSSGDADGICTGFQCAKCGVIHVEGLVAWTPDFYLSEGPSRVWGEA